RLRRECGPGARTGIGQGRAGRTRALCGGRPACRDVQGSVWHCHRRLPARRHLTQSLTGSGVQTSLSFTLALRRGAEAVEFYKRAFGATEVQRAESPDGNVVVQLEIGGDRFFVADESVEHANFSPESLDNRSSVRLALIVDEPDTVA